MVRKLRIQGERAICHVTFRGNARQAIFGDAGIGSGWRCIGLAPVPPWLIREPPLALMPAVLTSATQRRSSRSAAAPRQR